MQDANETILFEESLQVPYRYSAGSTVSRFFREIRDHRRIMAIRCDRCRKVYVPPRSVCGRCFSRLEDWVELTGAATVASFSFVHYAEPMFPHPPPLCYALLRLDGSDGGLVHLLGEVDQDQVRVGLRVEPVFAEEPKGTILDIRYFKPLLRA